MKRKRNTNKENYVTNPTPKKRRRIKSKNILPTQRAVWNYFMQCLFEELKKKGNLINWCNEKTKNQKTKSEVEYYEEFGPLFWRGEKKKYVKEQAKLKTQKTRAESLIISLENVKERFAEQHIYARKPKDKEMLKKRAETLTLIQILLSDLPSSFLKKVVNHFKTNQFFRVKDDYIKWIVAKVSGYKTHPKREYLEKNIDQIGKQNSYPPRLITGIPAEIMNEILKFVKLDKTTLKNLGMVNHSMHLWILHRWRKLHICERNMKRIPEIVWYATKYVRIKFAVPCGHKRFVIVGINKQRYIFNMLEKNKNLNTIDFFCQIFNVLNKYTFKTVKNLIVRMNEAWTPWTTVNISRVFPNLKTVQLQGLQNVEKYELDKLKKLKTVCILGEVKLCSDHVSEPFFFSGRLKLLSFLDNLKKVNNVTVILLRQTSYIPYRFLHMFNKQHVIFFEKMKERRKKKNDNSY